MKTGALFAILLSLTVIRSGQDIQSLRGASASHILDAVRPRSMSGYGNLPLSFEPNHGQADRGVKFLSRGSGYTLFLTDREAVFETQSGQDPSALRSLRMRVISGNPQPRLVGEDRLPGTANYFIGNDAANWHTAIPTYSRVRYAAVYPGIDLLYYGNQRQLEFDLVVAPGADPERIKLRFTGFRKLRITNDGDIIATTSDGQMTIHKPLAYQAEHAQQLRGQSDTRRMISGRFVLLGKRTVGFVVSGYDKRQALIIDPTLAYSTYLGGSGRDFGNGIASDGSGNVYLTGSTESTDFPVSPGAFQGTTNGLGVAFVTKLNPKGSAIVYSTYLGGSQSNDDSGAAIAVDPEGNAYVTGTAFSTNFPITPNPIQTSNNAAAGFGSNAFIAKLNPSGTSLIYSTYLGGSVSDSGAAIAVDAAGDAYVTGSGCQNNFPVTAGAFQTPNAVASSAFVSELNPSGTGLVYSTCLGSPTLYSSFGVGIALDGAGDAYIAGGTNADDFPVTQGAFQGSNNSFINSASNAFVSELGSGGSNLIFSTYLGGSGGDFATGIGRDTVGNVYVTGVTFSSDFPVTSGAFQLSNAASGNSFSNGFVTKLNSSGTALVYSTYLGGSGIPNSGGDLSNAIRIDQAGEAYVTGSATSTDFPITGDALQKQNNASSGNSNAFLAELNSAGNRLLFSTYLGGSNFDYAQAMALDGSGNVYVTGVSGSNDFPVTQSAFQTTNKSGVTSFVLKGSGFAPAGAALQFIPVTPCRMADTRNATGPFGGPEMAAGSTRDFDISQSGCQIPSDATAYSLNVTVVPDSTLHYLTIWPAGETQPLVSTLNSDGRVKANAAVVPAGANGGIDVFVTDATHVILDIDGYFVPAGTSGALAFYPVAPCRIADTRNADGPLGGPFMAGGTIRSFPIPSSNCGLPPTAQAYSLNITAVPHSTLHYLSTWPTGQTQPLVSTLNSSTGTVTANAAIVPAGINGAISVFVYDDADVILDVNGYFAPQNGQGLSLYTVTPCRVLDTRNDAGAFNGTLAVNVTGSSCSPPSTAQAFVLNATVVPQGVLDYLTLWSEAGTQPLVSTLNATDGAVTSNMAIVPASMGSINAFANGTTNLILDLSSYFAP